MYEDCKLHVLRWPQLSRLGATLVQLAALLGAPRYVDHYLRDLGPACLTPAASALLSQVRRCDHTSAKGLYIIHLKDHIGVRGSYTQCADACMGAYLICAKYSVQRHHNYVL